MAEKKKSVYSNIADDILEKIKNGTYAIGTLLPPERELMAVYKVQRTTIRRGLEILSSEGYIKKVAGLGSVVNSKVPVEVSENASAHETVVTTKAKTDAAILLPDGNTDKLPKFIPTLMGSLGKHGCFITSDATQIKSTSSVIVMGEDAELTNPHCLALCQSDDKRSVILDSDKGAYVALTYLENAGHTSIAFIGTNTGFAFENAVYDSFCAVNSFLDEELINLSGTDEKSGFDGFSELFRRHGNKFSAVCTVNDEVAKGVLKAASYYNITVPEQLSVISLCSGDRKSAIDSIYYDTDLLADEISESLGACKRVSTVLFGGNLSVKGTCSSTDSLSGDKKSMSNFLL